MGTTHKSHHFLVCPSSIASDREDNTSGMVVLTLFCWLCLGPACILATCHFGVLRVSLGSTHKSQHFLVCVLFHVMCRFSVLLGSSYCSLHPSSVSACSSSGVVFVLLILMLLLLLLLRILHLFLLLLCVRAHARNKTCRSLSTNLI